MKKYGLFSFLVILFFLSFVGMVQADLEDGLVSYWNFDNCDVIDASGNGYNGTLHGAPECVDGIKGRAYYLDSIDDYVNLHKTLDPNEMKAVSFWINSQGVDGINDSGTIIGKYSWYGQRSFIISSFSGDKNAVSVIYYADGDSYDGDSVSSYYEDQESLDTNKYTVINNRELKLNTWEHVVINTTSTEIEIWIDGEITTKVKRDYQQYFNSGETTYMGNTFLRGGDFVYNYRLNGTLDEFRIYNRPLSEPEIWELYTGMEASSDLCTINGTVSDSVTGKLIPEATLGFSYSGFNKEYQTDISGAFSITDIPAGTYQVKISAEGYQPETYEELTLTTGVPQNLTFSLEQNAPEITNPRADRIVIINNKEVQATFHAEITDPDGIADIQSVSLNLSDINSGSSNINMSLVDADTGHYEAVVTIPADNAARLYSVPVIAVDYSGYRDIETIEFEVTKKLTATISPAQTMTDAFDNQIDMQTLEISVQFNETVQQRQGANILRAGEDCYVEVRVYKPDGEFHETYQVYGFLDIVIDSAMEGQWTYETINYCAESIDVEIETRGSNTGILTGTVKDSTSRSGVENAAVDWALGGNATTDSQGFFSIVAVAGTCVLVTSSENYQTRLRGDVSLSSGKTTTLSIELVPENFVSLPVPESQSMEKILNPAGEADYLNQPFAAYVEDGNLVISTCFAPYQEPVSIYLLMTLNDPDFSSFFFLFNPDDQLDFFTDTLFPWREMTSDWNEIELFSVPVILLPKADYTFCFLLTDDPDTLSSFDFKFFTIRIE